MDNVKSDKNKLNYSKTKKEEINNYFVSVDNSLVEYAKLSHEKYLNSLPVEDRMINIEKQSYVNTD